MSTPEEIKAAQAMADNATKKALSQVQNPTQAQTNSAYNLLPMPEGVAQKPNFYPLTFAWDDPSQWVVTVNGIRIEKCIVELSEGKRGSRFDKIAVPGLHFEKLNYLGMALMTFKMRLEAYDQAALDELQKIQDTVFPSISDTGLRRYAPKLTKIQACGLNSVAVDTFIPTDESPAIWPDSVAQCHSWECGFIQWSRYLGPSVTQPGYRAADAGAFFNTGASSSTGRDPSENHPTGNP